MSNTKMPDIEIPGYKIIKPLGQGGMSSVYLAEQLSFGRLVAVKIMTPELADVEHFGHRFLREARLAANLNHPHIVQVFDTGSVDGMHYLTMEHLPGGDLKQRLLSGIGLLDSLDIIDALGAAIDYASSRKVVHRDIKPANLMFREDGSLAVVDFGIARDLSTETMVTQLGTVLGTPHYMSPEQSAGEVLDGRSDLYSLGIVFYELLTGSVPFTADSAAAIGIKHIQAETPALPEHLAIFQEVMDRILEKDRDQRYQSGADLTDDLEEIRLQLPDELQTTILQSTEVLQAQSGSLSGSISKRTNRTRRRTTRRAALIARRRRRKIAIVSAASLTAVAAVYFIAGPWPPLGGGEPPAAPIATTALPDDQVAAERVSAADSAIESGKIDASVQKVLDLSNKYLDKAEQALTTGDATAAAYYLEMALNVGASDAQSVSRLKQMETWHEKLSNNQAMLAALIDDAETQIATGRLYYPADNNAYTIVAELLASNPDNSRVLELQRSVDEASARKINRLLTVGNLSVANRELSRWEKVAAPLVTKTERSRYNALEQQRAKVADRTKNLLQQAKSLEERAGGDETLIFEAMAIYADIVNEQPQQMEAKIALQGLAEGQVEQGFEALAVGDLSRAEATLNQLKRIAPGTARLDALESQWQDQNNLYLSSMKSLDKTRTWLGTLEQEQPEADASSRAHRRYAENLMEAYDNLEDAEKIAPSEMNYDAARSRIMDFYLAGFDDCLAQKNTKVAETYLDVLEDSAPNYPGAEELLVSMTAKIENAAKPKKSRFSSF